jgi:hypothetical protein
MTKSPTGNRENTSATTSGISASKCGASESTSTTSISAWVNSRYRPSCGRSPRHAFWIWYRRNGNASRPAFSTTYRANGTVRSKWSPQRASSSSEDPESRDTA